MAIRYAGAGYFITDANGNINSGSGMADINDNGAVQSQAPLTGNVSAVSVTTRGRGTATFTIGSTTLNYAFYVVPPGRQDLPQLWRCRPMPISSGSPVTVASIAERGPTGGGTGFTNLNLNATARHGCQRRHL